MILVGLLLAFGALACIAGAASCVIQATRIPIPQRARMRWTAIAFLGIAYGLAMIGSIITAGR